MVEIGIFLSSEEHDGTELVHMARQAEEAGFRRAWISDHYHPWIDAQGHSPFVWSVLGGIAATTELHVTTAVTCPTFRIHPAVMAHAAATTAAMMPDRFTFGLGSGEALNEHVIGKRWPPADVRLEMLGEAIDLMRALWTGEQVDWRGDHYLMEGARLYTLPDGEIPIQISAFGSKAMDLVISRGAGWITVAPAPDLMRRFRAEGRGPAAAGTKVCWGPDEAAARRLAYERWPTSLVPGELNQELPMPAHFEQAVSQVTEDQVAEVIPCGPDPERHLANIRSYIDAGFDEIYISQIGPDQAGFLEFYQKELAPGLGLD
jgi:G6PDH family F420-dependent oxidoreductase